MSKRKTVTIARALTRRQTMAGGVATLVAAPFVIRSGFAQHAAVNIGVIQPLSGANAQFGINCRNGIELVADEINAAGGYQDARRRQDQRDRQRRNFEPDHSADRRATAYRPERTHCGPRRIRIVVDAGDFRGDGASGHSLSHPGVR
jgi:hypothetical protein